MIFRVGSTHQFLRFLWMGVFSVLIISCNQADSPSEIIETNAESFVFQTATPIATPDSAEIVAKANRSLDLDMIWEAETGFEEAIQADETNANAYLGRGKVLAIQGEHLQAIAAFTEAYRLDKALVEALFLRAESQFALENFTVAQQDYAQVLSLSNSFPDSALMLARAQDANGDITDAITGYEALIDQEEFDQASVNLALGHLYERNGQPANAHQAFQNYLAENPFDTEIWIQSGRLNIELGNSEAATSDFSNVIEIEPRNAEALFLRGTTHEALDLVELAIADYELARRQAYQVDTLFLNLGNLYLRQTNLQKTIAIATDALEIWPEEPTFYFLRGQAATFADSFDAALEDYDTAISLDKKWPFLLERGLLRQRLEDERAIADFNDAIELAPTQPTLFLARGDFLNAQSSFDLALADYDVAIELDPQFADAYLARAKLHRYFANSEQSLSDLENAIFYADTPIDGLKERAAVYKSLGRTELALADYSAALELTADNPNLLVLRGNSYRTGGDYDLALADYGAALAIAPNHLQALTARAELYANLDNLPLALAEYNSIISANPNEVDLYLSRAGIYQDLDDADSALADYDRAIGLAAQDSTVYVKRAAFLQSIDRYDDALNDLSRALEINDENVSALLNRARIYRQLRRYDDALVDYNRSIEVAPRNAGAHYQRGLFFENRQRFDEALEDYETASQLEIGNFSAHFAHGRLLNSLGRQDEALVEYDLALEFRPNFPPYLLARGQLFYDRNAFTQALADFGAILALTPSDDESHQTAQDYINLIDNQSGN